MTVAVSGIRDIRNGNGVATSFAFNFRYLDVDDIDVWFYDATDDSLTLWTRGTQYTISEVDGENFSVVVTGSAPESGDSIIVFSNRTYLQSTDITNGGAFNETTIEQSLDSLTILVQQLLDFANRSPRVRYDIPTTFDPEIAGDAEDIAGRYVILNSNGTGFTVGGLTSSTVAVSSYRLTLEDDGALAGPTFILERVSTTPAAADRIGLLALEARDVNGSVVDIAVGYGGVINNPSAELFTAWPQITNWREGVIRRWILSGASRVTVRNTAAQGASSSGTWTAATWNAALNEDEDQMWESGNATRLVPPVGATRVKVRAMLEFLGVVWPASANNQVGIRIFQDGAEIATSPVEVIHTVADARTVAISVPIESRVLEATNANYFEIQFYHNSGDASAMITTRSWAELEVVA